MHNRNFVINMVINGEKTPAFSARTLNLPPAQTDNSAAIIDNTRRLYSRSRAEVEHEISELVKPRFNAPEAQPPQLAVKTWPINAQTQVVTPDSPKPKEDKPAAAQPTGEGAPKRKRTRSRKRKPAGASPTSSSPTAQSDKNDKPNKPRMIKQEGSLPEKGTAEIPLR
jgi:hypothetical protein